MNIYDLKVKDVNNSEVSLEKYKNKILLIVNTATGCGFTPQYEGLQKLYNKYHDKGLEILDFPCDQFGHQAPGTNEEINQFCTLNYNTEFDRFAKVEVNGDDASELFKFLKSQIPYQKVNGIRDKMTMKAIEKISDTVKNDNDIRWNFTKFLIDTDGNVIKRYEPTLEPEKIEKDILDLIG